MIAAKTSMDVVRNVKRMYANGDDQVHVLAASIRHLDHLLAALALDVELITAPGKVLKEWGAKGFPLPQPGFNYRGVDSKGRNLKPIPYKELDLSSPWDRFNIAHELTKKGIDQACVEPVVGRRLSRNAVCLKVWIVAQRHAGFCPVRTGRVCK
jgi:transaldolase